jgi:L-amino acid N-acyltransferase YncA
VSIGGDGASDVTIRVALAPDLPTIVEIYNAAIPTRRSTADLEPVSVRSRVAWFALHDPARRPIWVVETSGVVVGWLSLSDYYPRPAYHATAEVGVYLAPRAQGRGLGRRLLEFAIAAAPTLGVRSLVWVTFADNAASIRLAEHAGFVEWGLLPRVTELDGVRRDVAILGRDIDERTPKAPRALLPGDLRNVGRDRVDLLRRQPFFERGHAAVTLGDVFRHLIFRGFFLVEVRADVASAAACRQRMAAHAASLLKNLFAGRRLNHRAAR